MGQNLTAAALMNLRAYRGHRWSPAMWTCNSWNGKARVCS